MSKTLDEVLMEIRKMRIARGEKHPCTGDCCDNTNTSNGNGHICSKSCEESSCEKKYVTRCSNCGVACNCEV